MTTNWVFTLKLLNSLSNLGGKIRITFPAGFTLSGSTTVTSLSNLNPMSPTVTLISSTVLDIAVTSVDSSDIQFQINNVQNPTSDNSSYFRIDTYDIQGFKMDYSDNNVMF